ncbi:ABC transporter substrate-binding protein [Corynebacterium freiburgense]|uniref:ABC transporter substrate-binding protein n=1 Tax=Corynebacterium freiburgense TaxID=556548 RepID=UPI00196A1865|nr:ABC transporter substrate-binding protein [Corynebacterium freiburgense]
MRSRYRAPWLVAVMVAITTLVSGCVTNVEGGLPDGWQDIRPAAVPEIQAMVPKEIADRGKIVIGTNPPFAPAEFKDSQGNIIGFDIDLARAVASVMGLELEVKDQDFSLILPAVSAGTVDFGASGFTDNEERRKNYDFVDYLNAGIQWASQPGNSVDPNNACGLTVAVQRTTVSDTDDVAGRSEECVAAGKEPIEKLAYDASDAAATAAILGRADAFSADSPVTAWAVERSDGRIELIGEIFDAAYYGWPVKKNSGLGPALAAALQHLIETGEYARIMKQWGLEDGLVESAMINGESIVGKENS